MDAKKAAPKKAAPKKAAPKKAVAKKKAASKKVSSKRAKAGSGKVALNERETLVNKVVAILWAEFVKAAQLPVDDNCFDEAIALGALTNVRRDISNMPNVNRADFQNLKKCSQIAGNRAKRLAKKKGASSITRSTFREAFNLVRIGVGNPTTKQGPGLKFVMFGPLCTPI